MPLFQGDSDAVIQMNIRKLIDEGYTPQQAAAIAYAEAEKYKQKRGKRWKRS
jgi:hypothetical protein